MSINDTAMEDPMFRIDTPSPNRVDLHIEGKIDADQMRDGLDQLFAASDGMKDGQMFYEIKDIQVPTAGAIAVEFGQLPKLFGLLGRFSRCAVLSDAGWVRKAAEIEGKLFPGLTIKSFEPDQRVAAEAWLATA
ncbi:MAG: STAS/SEC14 domain-containing protein [Pseudomonadota bacterium]